MPAGRAYTPEVRGERDWKTRGRLDGVSRAAQQPTPPLLTTLLAAVLELAAETLARGAGVLVTAKAFSSSASQCLDLSVLSPMAQLLAALLAVAFALAAGPQALVEDE